jgi:DNA gyrase subunit A
LQDSGTIDEVSLVPNARGFLIFSARGYIKRVREETFEAQRRGGKGKAAARLRENDALEQVVPVMAHDHVLFVTARGRAYCTRAYKLPEASRASAGTAMAQVGGAGVCVAGLGLV